VNRDARIKTLMAQTTTPNSLSLYSAFKQFENEIVQEQQSQLHTLAEAVLEAHAELRSGDYNMSYHDCYCEICQLAEKIMEVKDE